MERTLNDVDMKKIRDAKLINENETVLIVGDLVVAEDVVSKQRRVLDMKGLILESNRQLLRD